MIWSPRGINVVHILGCGANEKAYLDKDNSVVLCRTCQIKFDESGKAHEMKIYPRTEAIKQKMKLKYK